MVTIDNMKSVLTQSTLDALCERFHIPDVVHPELPGHNDRIRNSPVGQYLQELRENTFSGSKHEDANEHIKKFLEIVDLFHIPKVTQIRQYRAAGLGFYQRNNRNSSYPNRRQTLEESLTKFMAESAKRHEENSSIIKEI
ncbi:hypothetical protein Tco_0814557 [Tanacetum coccineum]